MCSIALDKSGVGWAGRRGIPSLIGAASAGQLLSSRAVLAAPLGRSRREPLRRSGSAGRGFPHVRSRATLAFGDRCAPHVPRETTRPQLAVLLFALLICSPVFGNDDSPAPEKIIIEAEDAGGMEFPFEIKRDEKSSGGMAVGVPEGLGKPPVAEGTVTCRFRVESDGKYALWVRKWWMDGCGNSLKLSVDESPRYLVGEDGTYKYWSWIKMAIPPTLELKAGDHMLTVCNNEDGVWFDQILIVNDTSYVPRGQELPGKAAPDDAEIRFADDFMREDNKTGAWKSVSGDWKISSIRNPERSSNAFHYLCAGKGRRLATAGYSFWKDYAIDVSVMSPGRADMGIVFLRTDESNYYLWRIPVASGRTMKLSKTVGGIEEVLLEIPRHLRSGQWYVLRVTVNRGNILLEIDNNEIARLTDFNHLRGGVGLFSEGVGEALFDDVLVRSVKFVSDGFSDLRLSGWRIEKGMFRSYTELDRAFARTVLGAFGVEDEPPKGKGPTLAAVGKGTAVTGSPYWDSYTFSFDVLPHLPVEWSVLVGATDDYEGIALTFKPVGDGVSVEVRDTGNSVHVPCTWLKVWHKVRIDNRRGALTLGVDGEVILKGAWPRMKGRVGFESGGGGVLFDNVTVKIHESPVPKEAITAQFAREKTMANWASKNYVWKDIQKNERRFWNRLDFPGDVEITYNYGGDIPNGETLRLGISTGERDEDAVYGMIVSCGRVELAAGKDQRVGADLEAPRVDSATLRRVGGTIEARINGRDVLKFRPLRVEGADRIWVGLGQSKIDVAKVSVTSDSTIDYVMGKAPADWRISNGQFEITNRWKCDPRWSWFSLMSPAEAVMWNKRSFRGDVSVDMWTSMRMELRRRPTYGDPGDMNLTICADGRSLGSGYSLIFGGYDNTVTRLLRKGEIVAETTKYLAPSTRHRMPPAMGPEGLHRRWFHVAIKKSGDTIKCFLDENLLFEYVDPEPIGGDRVAAWTFDNGIMISRVRISCENLGGPEPPLVADIGAAAPAIGPLPTITSSTHPFRAFYFETGCEGWGSRKKVDHFTFDWDPEAWEIKEDNAREVSVNIANREGGGRCLEVENLSGGGTFGVDVPLIGADLMEMPILSFDYSIQPGVVIDLYVKVGKKFHRIGLSGRKDAPYGTQTVGSVAALADGRWRSAKINLRDLFLSTASETEKIVIEDIFIGSMDNRDYIVCGIGGNFAGSKYRFDNVVLSRPGPAKGEVSWSSDKYELYRTCIDRNPETVPEGTAERRTDISFEDLDDGRWYFHIRPEDGSGDEPVLHAAIDVDGKAPAVLGSKPWDGGALRIGLDDGWGIGVDPYSIAVEHDGRMYSLDHPALSYDPVEAVVSLDPDRADLQFKSGQEITVSVIKLSDFLGNAVKEKVDCAWQIDYKNDFRPPSGVAVVPPVPYLVNDDFETDLGKWKAGGGKYAPELKRAPGGPAGGQWCLEVQTPRVGGSLECLYRGASFDAGKFPVLSFDYKITKDVDVDIGCIATSLRKYIHFADNGSNRHHMGSVPGVMQDGNWHHASFNLYEMLVKNDPYADVYMVEKIQFRDWGHTGNARGASFFIDNFRLEPVCAGSAESLRWKWAASDPSGISKVLYRLGDGAWKPVAASSTEWALRGSKDGYLPVIVKAADSLGNWSRPAGGGVVIDNSPPVFRKTFPRNGARTAANEIRIDVDDNLTGVDKQSIRLTLNNKSYMIKDPQIDYDPEGRRLTFAGWEGGKDIIFADQQEIRTTVILKDHAGNESRKVFNWTMDFASDTAGPPAPYVARTIENTTFKEDFEGTEEAWRKKFATSGARFERRSRDAATGRWCLTVFNTYERNFRLNLKLPKKVRPSEYPILSFDYKTEKKPLFNVYFKTKKAFFHVMFTDDYKNRRCKRLGKVTVGAEGKWHRVSLDLAELLRKNGKNPDIPIKNLYIGNMSRINPRKAMLCLDNVSLSRPQKTEGNMALQWTELVDATGIVSYSFGLDQSATTEPVEEKGKVTAERVSVPSRGTWFFHVRGRDGAGNWGKTAHYRIR